MNLSRWLRSLFRSNRAKRPEAEVSREERLSARLEADAATAEAEAVRQQFGPPVPPGGFGH